MATCYWVGAWAPGPAGHSTHAQPWLSMLNKLGIYRTGGCSGGARGERRVQHFGSHRNSQYRHVRTDLVLRRRRAAASRACA